MFCSFSQGRKEKKILYSVHYKIKKILTVHVCTTLQWYTGSGIRVTAEAQANHLIDHCNHLKVVCNEMNGGSDTCGLNSFWYGTHVIGVCLSFNGGVVF